MSRALRPMILEHRAANRADVGISMPKMSAIDLKALLSAERYDALSAMAHLDGTCMGCSAHTT